MTTTEEKIIEILITEQPDILVEDRYTINELVNDPELTDRIWRKKSKEVF
jgi:hypothetical protein